MATLPSSKKCAHPDKIEKFHASIFFGMKIPVRTLLVVCNLSGSRHNFNSNCRNSVIFIVCFEKALNTDRNALHHLSISFLVPEL